MVQFIILDGLPMLSKSTVRLNNVSWPLSTSNEDPLVFARLNSIVDSGLPIGITVTPEDNFYTGTIGFLERISSPKHKFVCSDPRNKK